MATMIRNTVGRNMRHLNRNQTSQRQRYDRGIRWMIASGFLFLTFLLIIIATHWWVAAAPILFFSIVTMAIGCWYRLFTQNQRRIASNDVIMTATPVNVGQWINPKGTSPYATQTSSGSWITNLQPAPGMTAPANSFWITTASGAPYVPSTVLSTSPGRLIMTQHSSPPQYELTPPHGQWQNYTPQPPSYYSVMSRPEQHMSQEQPSDERTASSDGQGATLEPSTHPPTYENIYGSKKF